MQPLSTDKPGEGAHKFSAFASFWKSNQTIRYSTRDMPEIVSGNTKKSSTRAWHRSLTPTPWPITNCAARLCGDDGASRRCPWYDWRCGRDDGGHGACRAADRRQNARLGRCFELLFDAAAGASLTSGALRRLWADHVAKRRGTRQHRDRLSAVVDRVDRHPANDLSRGCSAEDVYQMIAITGAQAAGLARPITEVQQ